MNKENQFCPRYCHLKAPDARKCQRKRILSNVDVNTFSSHQKSPSKVKLTRAVSESSYTPEYYTNAVFFKPQLKNKPLNDRRIVVQTQNGGFQPKELPRKSVNHQPLLNTRTNIDLHVAAFNRRSQSHALVSQHERNSLSREQIVSTHAKKISLSFKYYKILHDRNVPAYTTTVSAEVLRELVTFSLREDSKYILRKNILAVYNHSFINRNEILNWLYIIQNHLGVSSSTIFATVRLFDYVLSCNYMPADILRLIAITAFWMAHKFDNDRQPLMAPTLIRFCNGMYTTHNILEIERKLFKLFNYNIHVPDVTIFVEFYGNVNLFSRKELVKNCAIYILECNIFMSDFSSIPPYLQAMVAVKLALDIIFFKKNRWNELNFVPSTLDYEDLQFIATKMLNQVLRVQHVDYKYREPFVKYSESQYLRVSTLVHDQILC